MFPCKSKQFGRGLGKKAARGREKPETCFFR